MARRKIPDPLARRILIEKDLTEAKALEIAEAYLAEERPMDAIDFLAKAGASERFAELREQAIEAGDAFMLRSVAAASGVPPEAGEWEKLAAAAEAAGKQSYATDARRQAERGED